jgi:hypothetical protein
MASGKGYEATQRDANPSNLIGVDVWGSRLRSYRFSYKSPAAAAPGVGETVDLCDVDAGFRLLGAFVACEAFSSGGGTCGIDIGDAGDDDRLVAAHSIDGAAADWVVPRLDNAGVNGTEPTYGIGYKYTAKTRLRAKVTGEAMTTDKVLHGFVLGVID